MKYKLYRSPKLDTESPMPGDPGRRSRLRKGGKMLNKATYTSDGRTLKVSVERTDVLLKSESTLNFPRIVEMEGDRLVLPYGSGRHGGTETRPVSVSDDMGKTWTDAPAGFPMADNMQTSGILGYLRDGTIAYIDVFPVNAKWSPGDGPYHDVAAVKDPIFRLRKFSKQRDLLADSTFEVHGIPWDSASYELYGTLLEMENGDLLTAFHGNLAKPAETSSASSIFIGRSTDGGKTFDHEWTFSHRGLQVDEGLSESDLEVLANGDILCIMRSGSHSPMYQARSSDGGRTWSEPASIGWPGVKPHLRLLSNGVLACSSGRGVYGHPQVTYAMFSLDGTGEDWEYPMAFHTGPGCSYTSNMERDGKLYVVYSHSSFTKPSGTYGLPYHAIKWAVLDVSLSA